MITLYMYFKYIYIGIWYKFHTAIRSSVCPNSQDHFVPIWNLARHKFHINLKVQGHVERRKHIFFMSQKKYTFPASKSGDETLKNDILKKK